MVFGGMPVKWNGTGGEISQGTCKVSTVVGCVTSLSSKLWGGGGGYRRSISEMQGLLQEKTGERR